MVTKTVGVIGYVDHTKSVHGAVLAAIALSGAVPLEYTQSIGSWDKGKTEAVKAMLADIPVTKAMLADANPTSDLDTLKAQQTLRKAGHLIEDMVITYFSDKGSLRCAKCLDFLTNHRRHTVRYDDSKQYGY